MFFIYPCIFLRGVSSWGFEAQGVHLPLFFANLGTESLLIFNTFWGECGNSCGVSTGKRYFWEGVAAMLTGSGEGGMGIFFSVFNKGQWTESVLPRG